MRGEGKNPKYHPIIREYWRKAKQTEKEVNQVYKKCKENYE